MLYLKIINQERGRQLRHIPLQKLYPEAKKRQQIKNQTSDIQSRVYLDFYQNKQTNNKKLQTHNQQIAKPATVSL